MAGTFAKVRHFNVPLFRALAKVAERHVDDLN